MDQALRELGDYIDAGNAGAVLGIEVAYGELMVTAEASAVPKLLTFLRDDQNCQFKQLFDVTAVDYPDRAARFTVVSNLLSLRHTQRATVPPALAGGVTRLPVVAAPPAPPSGSADTPAEEPGSASTPTWMTIGLLGVTGQAGTIV